MGPSPSLSILIPTYGRARSLETLLRAISEDACVSSNGVPILVSDNASPDHTAETVRFLQDEFPSLDLRFHLQEENLGSVGNIAWLVENGPDTDYVWLIGDDDLPLPGAIGYVLESLGRGRPAVLHLPHRFHSGGTHTDSPCPSVLETFPSARELLLEYHHWLSFLSASVVQRSAMVEAVHDAPTENPWAPYIWYALAGRGRVCAVAPRQLVVGGGEISWRDTFGLYVTTGMTDAFDAGLRLIVDEYTYGRIIDGWQLFGAYWDTVPIDDLIVLVTRFPTSRLLRRILTQLATRHGRWDALLTADLAARSTGDAVIADQLVADGERRYLAGDLNGAANCFRAAIGEHPGHADAWCDLGVVLNAHGHAEAGEAFDRALELEPGHLDALLNRSSWDLSHGLFAQAVDGARRLLTLQPDHEHARNILAAAGRCRHPSRPGGRRR
jgi:glycosyltransferase involved in cell wall biosynthesis